MKAFADFGGDVFGDDSVALDDFVADDGGQIVYNQKHVDVSFAV